MEGFIIENKLRYYKISEQEFEHVQENFDIILDKIFMLEYGKDIAQCMLFSFFDRCGLEIDPQPFEDTHKLRLALKEMFKAINSIAYELSDDDCSEEFDDECMSKETINEIIEHILNAGYNYWKKWEDKKKEQEDNL